MELWDLVTVLLATTGAFLARPVVGLLFRSVSRPSDVMIVTRAGERIRVPGEGLTREKIRSIIERLEATRPEPPRRRVP